MQAQLTAYRQMAVAASARTRLVNATEGGAFIEGMEHLPLSTMTAALGATLPIAAKLRTALQPRQLPQRRGRLAKSLRALHQRLTALAAEAEALLPAARAGAASAEARARFRRQAAAIPFLATWAMGTRRDLREAGQRDDEDLALLVAAGEALRTYAPAIERALAELG
jgi:hypothetical protein